jgi:glycosyltransferase involved in cell wall biosynthesis
MQKLLIKLGIKENKIYLLYPGVDLDRFQPAAIAPSLTNIKILFATFPRSKEELEARGVDFIIDKARLHPELTFHLLGRKWDGGYTSLNIAKALINKNNLKNVITTNSIVADMSQIYKAHHFTIIPYTQSDGGKECPNSLIESLACGVPILISNISPFAYFVQENKCGAVFSFNENDFIFAIEECLENYELLRKNARNAAVNYFDQQKVFQFYDDLYKEIIQ